MKSGFPWLYLCGSGLFAFVACAESKTDRADLYEVEPQAGAAGAAGSPAKAGSAGAAPSGGAPSGGSAGAANGGGGAGGEPGAGGEAGAMSGGASGGGAAGKAAGGAPAIPCDNKLLLNEIQTTDSAGDEKYEFVELLNAGPEACTVSLAGYTLETDDKVLFTGDVANKIANGKRYVLAGSTFPSSDYGLGNLSIFPAAGACIRLRHKNTTVDEVCYGGPGAPLPPAGKSIGRVPDGADTDDDVADWAVLASPSPRTANVAP